MTDESRDPAQDAAAHMRAAALEMIGAARALLDVAEHLIKDPGPIVTAVAALTAATARPVEPPSSGEAESHREATGRDDAGTRARRSRPRVQHIRVS